MRAGNVPGTSLSGLCRDRGLTDPAPNPPPLQTLVVDDYIPVVASVAASSEGQALNVNADTAAGEVSRLGVPDRAALQHGMLGRRT